MAMARTLAFVLLSTLVALSPAEQQAASWMLISEPEADWWYTAPFKSMDQLYIGPFGIQDESGTFGVLPELHDRFARVVKAARAANPEIKIVVSQWWGEGKEKVWGKSLSHVDPYVQAYAKSVADFVQASGVDGYDIDYESSNVIPKISDLLVAIRGALKTGQLLSLSPSTTRYLTQENLKYVDHINMQSYEGGARVGVEAYTGLGFPSASLFYGLCPESRCSGAVTLERACEVAKANNLGGLHSWRLNSDNHDYEGQQETAMYNMIHAGTCDGSPQSMLLV